MFDKNKWLRLDLKKKLDCFKPVISKLYESSKLISEKKKHNKTPEELFSIFMSIKLQLAQ